MSKLKLDWGILRLLGPVYAIVEILHILQYSYLSSWGLIPSPYSVFEFIYKVAIPDYLVVLIFMLIVSILTRHLYFNKRNWKKVLLIHFVLAVFLSIFIFAVFHFYNLIAGHVKINDGRLLNSFLNDFMSNLNLNILVYLMLTGIIYVYYYVYKNKSEQYVTVRDKKAFLDSKFELLNTQLHPHFLFNSLNNISTLIRIDQDRAEKALVNLSELLREMLNYSNKNLSTIDTEIKILKKYADLLKLKYNELLDIHWDIDKSIHINHVKIPSLLLQPIIENAVKHGFNREKLIIKIIINKLPKGRLEITICNNGLPLRAEEFPVGKGIGNLKSRLKLLFRGDYQFRMKNKDGWVKTVLDIPFIPVEKSIKMENIF